MHLPFLETSAKTGFNVEVAFRTLVTMLAAREKYVFVLVVVAIVFRNGSLYNSPVALANRRLKSTAKRLNAKMTCG